MCNNTDNSVQIGGYLISICANVHAFMKPFSKDCKLTTNTYFYMNIELYVVKFCNKSHY